MKNLRRRYKGHDKISEPQNAHKGDRFGVSMLLYSKQFVFTRKSQGFDKESEKQGPMKGSRARTQLRSQMVILIVFLLFYCQALAFYPSQGGNGYFGESENGVPGDSSCKTCLDVMTGETGEGFMRYNSTTKLGESCAEGEYYDPIKGDCSSGNNVGIQAGAYQASCFECPPNKIFDIDIFECVELCPSDKIEIVSNKMNIGRIGRTLKFYVDPEVDSIIELGTFKYPYRTFKSVASEILNHYSNTKAEVEIFFIKDGYIEMDMLYFINMTSVKITTHPDYQLLNKRAQISFTSKAQHEISKKARFHLLKDTSISHEEFINKDELSEREISELSKIKVGIMLARTSIEVSEIEFHASDLGYFGVPIYLQEKQVKLCKV